MPGGRSAEPSCLLSASLDERLLPDTALAGSPLSPTFPSIAMRRVEILTLPDGQLLGRRPLQVFASCNVVLAEQGQRRPTPSPRSPPAAGRSRCPPASAWWSFRPWRRRAGWSCSSSARAARRAVQHYPGPAGGRVDRGAGRVRPRQSRPRAALPAARPVRSRREGDRALWLRLGGDHAAQLPAPARGDAVGMARAVRGRRSDANERVYFEVCRIM